MDWQIILALIIVIPVILLPVALIWYLNIGGILAAVKEARERKRVAEQVKSEVTAENKAVAEQVAVKANAR